MKIFALDTRRASFVAKVLCSAWSLNEKSYRCVRNDLPLRLSPFATMKTTPHGSSFVSSFSRPCTLSEPRSRHCPVYRATDLVPRSPTWSRLGRAKRNDKKALLKAPCRVSSHIVKHKSLYRHVYIYRAYIYIIYVYLLRIRLLLSLTATVHLLTEIYHRCYDIDYRYIVSFYRMCTGTLQKSRTPRAGTVCNSRIFLAPTTHAYTHFAELTGTYACRVAAPLIVLSLPCAPRFSRAPSAFTINWRAYSRNHRKRHV